MLLGETVSADIDLKGTTNSERIEVLGLGLAYVNYRIKQKQLLHEK